MLTLFALLSLTTPSFADEPAAPSFTADQVLARMTAELKDTCDFDEDTVKERPAQVTVHAFQAKDYDNVRSYQLFEIPCTRGAYNFGSVYYLADAYGALRHVRFAEPAFGEKDEVIGWETSELLINSGFEPKDLSLSFFSKGRGIGDCFSAGTYRFVNGRFLLKRYDYDGKCDGKINPRKIVNLK